MQVLKAWLQFFNLLFKTEEEFKHSYLQTGVIHFFVRREIAKRIFISDYDKLGRFIQVTNDQYKELFEIEGGKLNPNTKRDDELVTKIKEIIKVNKGIYIKDAVD